MLVLSRHRNESIVIELPTGELIEVTLVDIRGDKARIGFSAPRHVPVHRREVYDSIQRQKESADGKEGER